MEVFLQSYAVHDREVERVVSYEPDNSNELWWCNSHRRRATYLRKRFTDACWGHVCDPHLGGILLPCVCVNLTNDIELVETELVGAVYG